MPDFDQFKEIFLQEADELLLTVDDCLTQLSEQDHDSEALIGESFRAIHSIKGSASMFGFTRLVEFCHEFEALLSKIQSGDVAISDEFLDAAVASVDFLRTLTNKSVNDQPIAKDAGKDLFDTFVCLRQQAETGQKDDPADAIPPEAELSKAEPEQQDAPDSKQDPKQSKPKSSIEKSAPAQQPILTEKRSTVRVHLGKVDQLVDLVGESAILQSILLQKLDNAGISRDPDLVNALMRQQQLFRTVQDGVMLLRAQPIQTIFRRMPNIVRDAARKSGKEVDLIITGGDTEIDMSIIETLLDPLVHIMRNCVGHGIESSKERAKLKKPARGRISLSAWQKGDGIIVEVSDDGKGLDRDALRKKALAADVITTDMELSDQDIDRLIFAPGVTTVNQVSDLSGRGVGMDVVEKNIHNIGGRISVKTKQNEGTTFTITLPLTLAVLDGMQVDVATESYIIPLGSVKECSRLPFSKILSLADDKKFYIQRGEVVPLISLADHFGLPNQSSDDSMLCVFVEQEDGKLCGILVDEIQGNRQVVVKSIREQFDYLPGLAGGTILGDGRPAFILDIDELANTYANNQHAASKILSDGAYGSECEVA